MSKTEEGECATYYFWGIVTGFVVFSLLFGYMALRNVQVSIALLNEVCAELDGGEYMFDRIHEVDKRSDGLNSQLVCKKRPENNRAIVFVKEDVDNPDTF